MDDNRIKRCQALFSYYEKHGLPEDEETAINAVAAILTGELPEEASQSVESRLESLEQAVSVLAERLSTPEVGEPHRPSLRSNRYADFLRNLHNLTLNLEQVGGEVKADKVAEALDNLIVDFYEGGKCAQSDV